MDDCCGSASSQVASAREWYSFCSQSSSLSSLRVRFCSRREFGNWRVLYYGAVIALVMAVAAPLTFGAAGSAAPALGASDPAVMAASALVGGALLAASALLPRRNPEGYLFQIAAPLLAVGLASIPLLVRNVPLALPLLLSCSMYFFGILWYFVSLADDGSAPLWTHGA